VSVYELFERPSYK